MPFAINTAYTLPEILRSRAPDGSHMSMVDVLSANNPLLEEGYWEQANGDTTHETLRVVDEPTGTFVRYNEGTPNSAVSTVPVLEYLARLEDRLQIDIRALEKAPNPISYRREREAAHFRGLVKTFHKTIFAKDGYGVRAADLKQIDGLATRYNAVAAGSVVSNGGSGDELSSIWIIKHGVDGFQFLYPKSMDRTLKVDDLKIQPAYDASGNRYEVVMTRFAWEFGMNIADPRCVKRLANITAFGNNSFYQDGTNVLKGEEALIDLIEALPKGDTSNTVIYCGPTVMTQFRKRMNAKTNMYFTQETVWGRPMLTFQGIPIKRVDVLTQDESAVS